MTAIASPTRLPKVLSESAIKQFRQEGYYFPVRALSAADALAYRRRLEEHEARTGSPLAGSMRHKAHLLFTWLWDLVHDPRILDPIEDIYGPNLFCWSTNFFIKEANDPSFVSWHQDATYWGLSTPDVITAWVAFSPATIEAGAMKVAPRTHRQQLAHRDTFNVLNLLTRGQEIAVDIDQSQAVDMVVAPGEMSLHHVLLCHGSEPNRSNDRRIGFAIRYVPTHVRQISGVRDSATLVRGTDTFNHFVHEVKPEADLHPAAVTRHAEITGQQAKILYRGTATESFDQVVRP
ncbi:MAG: phytanoyl-CoA dioxygenase [Betaproteobacteria bacterium]|nr:phytanoyl-CoA dioxygenase [Betaproteobacteria bacterium]